MFEVWMQERSKIEHLFAEHDNARAILFQLMRLGLGYVRVDSQANPNVAWFHYHPINFLAGIAHSEESHLLVDRIPYLNIIIVPTEDWNSLVKEKYGDELRIQKRTRFSPDSLDLTEIRHLKQKIPAEVDLQRINRDNLRTVYPAVRRTIDLHFGSINGLLKQGVGFCAVYGKRIVSLAYSAFPFIDEFEVQVDTVDDPSYRRRGLATAVSATLIEYALENDMVPHWDASNLASIRLAEKLGYSDPISWEAYYRKKS
ncbi:GNAT family N-acetyltransferase [Candidatus Thorarchaeota archaeon]|nr:MAG: GNAT family N-acetyltransferase [Candidatus Thorarchaeota archaeon]